MIGSFRRRLGRSSMIGKASFSFFNAQQRASSTHITKKTLRRRIAICCYVRRKEYVYAILYVYSCKSTRAARNGCAFHFGPSSVQRTGSCISSNSKQLPPTYDPTRLNDTATKHNEYKRIFLRQLSYEHKRTPQRYGHCQPTHQRCTLFNGKRIRGDYWVRVVRNNKKRLRTTQLYTLCTLYYTEPASSTPSHHHQLEMICGSNSTERMNAPHGLQARVRVLHIMLFDKMRVKCRFQTQTICVFLVKRLTLKIYTYLYLYISTLRCAPT